VLKKKIWANFQRIIELFTQKIVTKLSKIWLWDPGSGKNLFRIPDPGVKKAPDPGIRIRNTDYFYKIVSNFGVKDPDLGSGMGKKSGSESGMNITNHFSESLETVFRVKNT
jgi:hypothetical protein